MENSKRRWLLGLPLDLVSMDEAVALCLARMGARGAPPLRVLTANLELLARARRDHELAACFGGETLIIPDGIGAVLAGRRYGWPMPAKIAGVDFGLRLAASAAKRQGGGIFLYGGRPGVAARAASFLAGACPGLAVAGVAHGYLSQAEAEALPRCIAATGAAAVFVCLGMPRQELWLKRHLAATGARLGVGLGGSFDIFAGRFRRAPAIWQRLGLEWLYRLGQEPARWRRLAALPGFLWQVLRNPRPEI